MSQGPSNLFDNQFHPRTFAKKKIHQIPIGPMDMFWIPQVPQVPFITSTGSTEPGVPGETSWATGLQLDGHGSSWESSISHEGSMGFGIFT